MDQPSVSHDGFVFEEFGVSPGDIKRALKNKQAQRDKTIAQGNKARETIKNFDAKVKARIISRRRTTEEKIKKYQELIADLEDSLENIPQQVEEELQETQEYEKAQSARQDVEMSDDRLFTETLEIQQLEDAQFNAELFQDLKGREKDALQDPVFQEQIRILADKLKAEKRKAKEKAKQAEKDERQAQKKAEREQRDKKKQELKEKEKKAREEIRAAEKAQAQAQNLQERLFRAKYKGKIFYFENPDQVKDTKILTLINNPSSSYYQGFTSFFTGGSNFYYLADDKISAYDFDVSALRIIAEPYLKSLGNGVTFEEKKNLLDNGGDWQEFLEDLQKRNYYMKDKPWSLKNAEKFARGMDNVFKSDPRAQKNTDVASAKGQNVRYGVAFDKSMGAGHFVFKTKKEKIKVVKPIEPSSVFEDENEEDDSSMSEDEDDFRGEFSGIVFEEGLEDPQLAELDRNTSSDEEDFNMNEIESNISSALDLIKI